MEERVSMTRAVLLALIGVLVAGCSGVARPTAVVESVSVAERTSDGARVEVTVVVNNPNDVALPVRAADYRVAVADLGVFEFDAVPPVSLPPNGEQRLVLAASFADGVESLAGRSVEVEGDLRYQPPGLFRKILNDYRWPLPKAEFEGEAKLGEAKAGASVN